MGRRVATAVGFGMTTVNHDLEALADPFKVRAHRLVELLEREGLPFQVFETRRSFSRSAELYMQGRAVVAGVVTKVGPTVTNAGAGSSPHNWGLAVDCILVTKDHDWWHGHEIDLPTGAWDTGYEKGRLIRPIVKLAWERYARAVKTVDCVWGGGWTGFPDFPHCEHPQWQTLRPANWKPIAQREVEAGR